MSNPLQLDCQLLLSTALISEYRSLFLNSIQITEDKQSGHGLCATPHRDELALSGEEALSNPLKELSLISHNTHYRKNQSQGALVGRANVEKEKLPI